MLSLSLLSFNQRNDRGIAGDILFNDEGKRIEFQLEILELSKIGFKKIGSWDGVQGVTYTRTLGEAYDQIVESLQNKTFTVASRAYNFLHQPHIRPSTHNFRLNHFLYGTYILSSIIVVILNSKFNLKLLISSDTFFSSGRFIEQRNL